MDKTHNYIVAYLNGELTSDEVIAFEKKLETDPQLAAALKFEEETRIAFTNDNWFSEDTKNYDAELVEKYMTFCNSKEAQELEGKIEEVLTKNRRTLKKSRLRYALAAACVAGMVLVYMLWPQETPNYQELYTKTKSVEMEKLPSLVTRSTNDSLLEQGQSAFDAKNYGEAVYFLSKYNSVSKEKDFYANIYLGFAYLELDKSDEAIETFRTLEVPGSLDGGLAKWYRALAYLKKEDVVRLKQLLHEIVDQKGPNHLEAEKLLHQLD